MRDWRVWLGLALCALLWGCERGEVAARPAPRLPAASVVADAAQGPPASSPVQAGIVAVQVQDSARLLEDAEALGAMPQGAAPSLKLGAGVGQTIEPVDGVLEVSGARFIGAPQGARAFEPVGADEARVTYLYEGDRHVATLLARAWEAAPGDVLPPEAPVRGEVESVRFMERGGARSEGARVRMVSRYEHIELSWAAGVDWPLKGFVVVPPAERACLDEEGCPRRACVCADGRIVQGPMACGEEGLCTESGLPSCDTMCEDG